MYDVVIVGAGPAGIFAALELVKDSTTAARVLILEKGRDLEGRVCLSQQAPGTSCRRCSPCRVVSGWGGAGAFSDGKLTLSTEVGGMLDAYIDRGELEDLVRYVDQVYMQFGAPEEVYGEDSEAIRELERKATLAELRLIPSRIRHLGTGRTKEILERMQQYLEGKVDIALETAATRILARDGEVTGVETQEGSLIRAKYVVVAPGREGAEWLVSQARALGLGTAINPVDIGVRVELPAAVMEAITNVTYEAKLIYHSRSFDDKVRTFCMCPYGEVVTESNDGLITVNGHSHAHRKTANTNFALLVSKTFTEPFREPITYGKYIAGLANLLGGGVIVQRLGDLLSGRRSTEERIRKGTVRPTLEDATPGDLSLVFPYRHLVDIMEMLRALDAIAPGVYSRNTLLYGVEVKFYSSRLALSNVLETQIRGLFSAGDGAGVTRGLMQASISGVIVAREILRRMKA
ncbi:MAG TPA: NAD(P)/FAD-dependent oxidoreductase [Firmicutes bacterium]|nr:NAD(P)/FAD-dependent oxidoreductase [Bacillota bacterium]